MTHLGRASCTYEVGIFDQGVEEVCAVGGFTHVFVERDERRVRRGIEGELREGLRAICAEGAEKIQGTPEGESAKL